MIGPLGFPLGGISSYCSRCVFGVLKGSYSEAVDVYAKSKLDLSSIDCIHYAPAFANKLYRMLWLWYRVQASSAEILHINFSSTKSLLLFLFCFKRGRRWVLMLHNGRLQEGWISSNLMRTILNRFDKIVYISGMQKAFYSRYIDEKRLVSLKSYMPPVACSASVKEEVQTFLMSHTKNILGSGYQLDYYRFDFLVRFAAENSEIGVVIVTYGDSEVAVVDMLRNASRTIPNIRVLNAMSEGEFIALLEAVDIYVRPNDVDSFGLACADAIVLGTSVVASDVCERFPGVMTFRTGSYVDFKKALLDIFSRSMNLDPVESGAFKDSIVLSYKDIYESTGSY